MSIGAAGSERQIVNVAAGTEATDATNLGQVQGLIADAGALDVLYDDPTFATVTFAGAGGTVLSNVGAGEISATSTEAINGSQLFDTNELVAGNAQDILDLDGRVTVNEGDIASLDGRVTANEGDILDLGDRVTVNEGDIADLDGRVTVNEGDIANLDTRVTNVEGDVTALDGRVTDIEGDVAVIDGRVTDVENRVTNVEGDVAVLDDRVTVNEGGIANLDGRVTVNEGVIANLDTRVTTNEGDIVDLGDRVAVNEGDIVSIDARVTDNSTRITELGTQIGNVPVGYVSDTDPSVRSDVPTDTVALIGAGDGPVTLTNVAAGDLAAGSSDAVNGSQLFATNTQVAVNSGAIADNRADIDANRIDIDANRADIDRIDSNLAGSTVVAVQYSDPSAPTVSNGGTITNDVTLVGADPSAPVALHNVADGTAATDAVNLRQLQSGLSGVLADSMAYTDARFLEVDQRFQSISFDLNDVRRDSYAGTAGAAALANLPQPMDSGRSMLSGGVGHHRGETAFAIGFSSALGEDFVVKAGASIDSRGSGTFGAGAGFQF